MVFTRAKDAFSEHARLGGIGAQVAEQIEELTGKETRCLVLGHLQRGGAPVTSDRLLALRLGTAATRFLAETEDAVSGMVAIVGQHVLLMPLAVATSGLRTVPFDSEVLQTGRDLRLCFGDEPAGTFLNATVAPHAGPWAAQRLTRGPERLCCIRENADARYDSGAKPFRNIYPATRP